VKQSMKDRSTPLVYVITDRRLMGEQASLPEPTRLLKFIERAIDARADMIQIRERDLSARDLCSIAEAAVNRAHNSVTRILINDRADIAASVGAGVHITTRSLPAKVVRATFGADLLIGVSTHSLEEAESAEEGGADFIVFGPVYETASKEQYGPPIGLDRLRVATGRLRIPVLALGGISPSNYRETLSAGAAGVAGISIFAESNDLKRLVATIKMF